MEMKLLIENQNESHINQYGKFDIQINSFLQQEQMMEELKKKELDDDNIIFDNSTLNQSKNNEIENIDDDVIEQECNLSSKENISNSQIVQSNQCEEQFQQLINKYTNKLQYQVKRVKQSIKKGQQIRKKKLFFSPISNLLVYNIQQKHKFMVYGFIILEDQFQDYEDQYSPNLINQYDEYMRLEYIEKDRNNQMITFCVTPIADNLMKNFKTICQYYEYAGDADYKKLADLLRKFESFINVYDEKWKQLYENYSLSEIENFLETYQNEAVKYAKNNSKEEFTGYQLFNYNFKNKQLQPFKNGNSFDACTLIGLHIELIEKVLKKINSFHDPVGKQRMDQIMQTLELFSSGCERLQDMPTTIHTIDGITIRLKSNVSFFNSDKLPKDVNAVLKYLCVINQYQVDLFEIKRVMCERGEVIQNLYAQIDNENNHLESIIMQELFLEKFYPEQYNKLK